MEAAIDSVFILWHVHEVNEIDDEKLIGVYRDEEGAKAAVERLKDKPGFRNTTEGFEYHRYQLGEDHWTEGFIQVDSLPPENVDS